MISKAKKVNDLRELATELPYIRYVDPEFVYINLTTKRASKYKLNVKNGDHVCMGQIIGERDGGFFKQPIYSTISGIVVKKVKKLNQEYLLIRNDFNEQYCYTILDRSEDMIHQMSREEMIEIIKNKSLVGLGGSGFPTYIKMSTKENIDTVVINAVECEPYLNSDYRMVKDHPDQIFKGLTYILQIMDAKKGVIAVKKDKTQLIEIIEREIKRYSDYDIELAKLDNYYPQGWEIEMFKNALGIKVPSGSLPMEYGIIAFNVSTCASVYDAIKHNMPVTKRYLTVNGDAIKFPQSIRVRVGTNVRDLIKKCDGYIDDVDNVNVILGGPMMGEATDTDDIIVTPTTTSVLVFKDQNYIEETCVRCASCVLSCPVDIQPVQVMNAVKRNDVKSLELLEANKCIECGLCAYVCTSKIHVTNYVRKGKKMLGDHNANN
jgi:electron transport complex protein RnfC